MVVLGGGGRGRVATSDRCCMDIPGSTTQVGARMLTVKFRQPSHEFTFGVGMSFIPYPLVLPPWYNKFVRACRFWSLVFMQGFSVESKTSGISSSNTL
jgi:hypothetical protein